MANVSSKIIYRLIPYAIVLRIARTLSVSIFFTAVVFKCLRNQSILGKKKVEIYFKIEIEMGKVNG